MDEPELEKMPPAFFALVETGYWVLPKPADLSILLFDALGAGGSFSKPHALQTLQARGDFHPELSLLTSVLFAALILALAAREFVTKDY